MTFYMIPISQVITKNDFIELLLKLGLKSKANVLVHSSMSKLGYVVNGANDIIDALIEVVGATGTILMPAHSGQLSDPSSWTNPTISEREINKVKKNMSVFDKKLTPVRARGVIPSTFLNYPGVKRSEHPLNSVSALGSNSLYFTSEHDFNEPEGINSPIGKLYKKDGKVLLIGVGLSSCSAVHLAEYLADVEYLYDDNPTVLKEKIKGLNNFVQIKKYPRTSEFFDKYITELNDKDYFMNERFGSASIILFDIKPVIDFFVAKLNVDPYCLIKPNIIK